jgi:Flp pilus assembly protein TadG
MNVPRALLACRRGAAAVELALMLPLLTVMLFGGIEVSYYFYNEHQIIKGLRDGARYASRQSFVSINCTGSTIPTTVEDSIKEVARTGQVSGGTARVPGWANEDIAIDLTCPGADGGTAVTTGIYAEEPDAPVVTLSTTVGYEPLFAGVGILTSDLSHSAEQQSAVMGI